jgi:hypothetical protein
MLGSNAARTGALASIARQLGYALDETATVEGAFQKLHAVADPRQQAVLKELEGLLRSPEPDGTVGRTVKLSAFPTLAWLLKQARTPERAAAALFREFRRHESFSAATIAGIKSEFGGFLAYLGAVLGVLVVVAFVYGLFVLPQYRWLYASFGRELPTLTGVVFVRAAPIFTILILLSVGLLIFLNWFVFLLRRRLRCYLPMPASYRRVPLIGPVMLAYNEYLWLSYAGLLRAEGVPTAEALRIADSRMPLLSSAPIDAALDGLESTPRPPRSCAVSDLITAARLGRLDDESNFQQGAAADTFVAALGRCRRRAQIILAVCTYFLVVTFVAAMYLPIFSLGSGI